MSKRVNKKKFFMVRVALLLFVLFSSWTALFGSDAKKKTISRIDIVGNFSVDSQTILSQLKSKVGNVFSQHAVDFDLKYIYSLGYFSDVSVEIDDFMGGDSITFVVEERFTVDSLEIVGNCFFKTKHLLRKIGLKKSDVFDKKKLYEGIEKIKNLYAEKGFVGADVDPRITKDNFTRRVTVLIMIYEEDRFFIKNIIFIGNTNVSSHRLKKIMTLKKKGLFQKGLFKEKTLKDDIEKMKSFYRIKGYYNVKIEIEKIFYDKKNKKVTLFLSVEEGEYYSVKVIDFEGKDLDSKSKMSSILLMKEGDPFSEEKLFANQKKLLAYYAEKGYLRNEVRTAFEIDKETHCVYVTYFIVKGKISYVEKIIIQGNIETKDKVIRREVSVYPLDPFDGTSIKNSRKNIMRLGYFESVDFETSAGSVPNMRNLIITVKEKKTGEFSFGGGYSSIDKLVGFADISKNNFDLFNFPSFTGGGQRVHLRGELGSAHQNYSFSFFEPWLCDRPLGFGFDVYQKFYPQYRIEKGYEKSRKGIVLRLSFPFSSHIYTNFYVKQEYIRYEKTVKVKDITNYQKMIDQDCVRTLGVFLTMPSHHSLYGFTHRLSFEPSGGPLGGDCDLIRLSYLCNFFYSVSQNSVFKIRTSISSVKPFSKTKTVPSYETLYAGGAGSVRGYRNRAINCYSEDLGVIGGNSRFLFSTEYVFPIVNLIKGAVFFDTGNVWKGFNDWDLTDLKMGIGVGLRIKTQLGPINLDYGFALDAPEGQDDRRLHFSVGSFF